MSLLMQALKKAEDAKRRQTADAPDRSTDPVAPFPSLSDPFSPEGMPTPAVQSVQIRAEPAMDFSNLQLVEAETNSGSDMAVEENGAPPRPEPIPAMPAAPASAPATTATDIKPATSPEAAALPPMTEAAPSRHPVRTVPEPTTPPPAGTQPMTQEAARIVFSAKQPADGRRRAVLAGCFISGILIAGAGYFYLQNTISEISSSQTVLFPPAQPGANPTDRLAPPPGEPVPNAAPPVENATQAAASAPETPVVPAAQAKNAKGAAGMDGGAVAETSRPQTELSEDAASAIRIRRGVETPRVNPALQRGYDSYLAGELEAAMQAYRSVLRQDPGSRDALLGLAAVSVRRGQYTEASNAYVRLLELDPADPDANAGLSSLQQADPVQAESRLKTILAHHPQAAALWFSLGNLYARQSRWNEAQQAYFNAFGGAPANPDYAFNLAVSLDQLSQARIAAEYYRRALSLSESAPAAFARSAVQARLAELQPAR